MTRLLTKAFEEASKQSELEQNILAQWIIDEIISERKWENVLADSEDVLEQLADHALAEHADGKTRPMDITQL